jgi:hypothetical protein
MAIVNLTTIKNWFRTGLKPTQTQFWDTWDSFRHKSDKVPVADIDGIEAIVNSKADKTTLNSHLTDENAHADLFTAKEDKTQKGAPSGYAPLDEFTKLAAKYLTIVNDLVTGGSTALLSAEQGKVLQTQINAINTLLTSDNVNLDTVQELVDAIETVQVSLNTILVNDLTTGGTTKALTAEMGKSLKNLVDALTTTVAGIDSNVVHKTGTETIAGNKIFTGKTKFGNTSAALFTVDIDSGDGIPVTSGSAANGDFRIGRTGYAIDFGVAAANGYNWIQSRNREDYSVPRELRINPNGGDVLIGGNLKFNNYPSTRNDGQLPTNKVLAPDATGNLKLYTIATAPAPYMEVLIPDSTLPSTTTNFTIKGAFFTPTMTVSIVGQTINYITFVSDNLVKVNVTTGATEGLFSVTLNNGISATFNNALSIVLGTIFNTNEGDWIKTQPIDAVLNEVNVKTFGSIGKAKSPIVIDITKNWEIRFVFKATPLGYANNHLSYIPGIRLKNISDNSEQYRFGLYLGSGGTGAGFMWASDDIRVGASYAFGGGGGSINTPSYYNEGNIIQLRWRNGIFYLYYNNVLKRTYVNAFTTNLYMEFETSVFDITGIKYIELAT